DSPELARTTPRPIPQRPPALLPWVVPALLVDAAELGEASPQVRYGASIAHLRALAAFADDLATRGRILPSLVVEAGPPAAPWPPSPPRSGGRGVAVRPDRCRCPISCRRARPGRRRRRACRGAVRLGCCRRGSHRPGACPVPPDGTAGGARRSGGGGVAHRVR